LVALCLVLLGGLGAVSASASTSNGGGHTPVNVCHATSSDTNPYVFITVDDDSVKLQGHLMHRDDPNKQWKSDGTWRGEAVHAGDAKPDLIGDYTDKDGVLHPYDGVIDEASDCGGLTATVTEPDGSFTTKCTSDGAAVTIGDLTSGTFEDVGWTLTYGQSSSPVHQGDVVPVLGGVTVKLAWSSGDESGVVQSGEAPAACPPAETEAPSGTFTQECAQDGVVVTLSGLDAGTYSDVAWTFTFGTHTVSNVTNGQQVAVDSGDELTLTWQSGQSTGTAKSGTAKECPTPPVCVSSISTSDVNAHYTTDAFHAVVTYTGPTPLCEGVSKVVSLNSYLVGGPTWPTSGTQVFVDHDSVTIDKTHTSGTLVVDVPSCFYQTDLYFGGTRYDGTDGPVPHYDDVRIAGLIDHRNGGDGCTPPLPPAVDASGSFTVTCDADGAVVTVGTLSHDAGVSWRLQVAGGTHVAATGDVVQVPAESDLALVWRVGNDTHVEQSAKAPKSCPAIVTTPPVPVQPTRGLTVTKTVTPVGAASFGDTLTYGLTVAATGTAGQTAVTVTDAVPTGTSYLTGTATCAGGCASVTVAKGTVTWVIGDMAAGSTRSVSFQVTINTPEADADGGLPAVTIVNVGAAGSAELPSRASNEVETPVAAVLGVKVGQPGGPDVEASQLPHTGANGSLWRIMWAALLLIGLGGGLLMQASTGGLPGRHRPAARR
jgi:uncharacterized repeat protein (TIGR01451 family)